MRHKRGHVTALGQGRYRFGYGSLLPANTGTGYRALSFTARSVTDGVRSSRRYRASLAELAYHFREE